MQRYKKLGHKLGRISTKEAKKQAIKDMREYRDLYEHSKEMRPDIFQYEKLIFDYTSMKIAFRFGLLNDIL